MTSGRVADVGRAVAGDLVPLVGIENTLTRLSGYRAATTEAETFSGAMQNTLSVLDALSNEIAPALLGAANSGNAATIAILAQDASQKFDSAVNALNTRIGDRTLFAGVAIDGPALADPETILAALEAAIAGAGAVTANDIAAAVTNWFADPAGYATAGYLGGDGLSALAVSADDRVNLTLTAADPAIGDTLKGLALATLLDRGLLASNHTERAALAQKAGAALIQSQTDRTEIAARLGTTQARIEAASVRNDSERSALEIARAGLLAVDPFEAATRLEATQSQLEALYAVTARLSRLSLVDFLR
ncbi:MAG: flagellin [Paracoccaceae bacterium]|nr:flagellin [Paracoccaceae bacterium]